MEKCTTPGCENTVSKAGFKLCFDCWKKQRAGGGKQQAAAKASGRGGVLNATKIGEHFGLKSARVNALLNELGWIARGIKGWKPTNLGKTIGAEERRHPQTGKPFALWPPEVLENKILVAAVKEHLGESPGAAAPQESAAAKPAASDFRNKFKAGEFRATDGHWVRSKAEMLIDNYLYTANIVHAYERKLPVEEDVFCDFYLPHGKVYIEYWGLENEPAYLKRKEAKLAIYRKYDFKLIELRDDEVQNLDDHMPRLLLPFGITVD